MAASLLPCVMLVWLHLRLRRGEIFVYMYVKVITGGSLGDLFRNNVVMSLRIICCPETGLFPRGVAATN